MKIPDKYSKGKARPVKTVGAMVKQLQELPKSLRVSVGFSDAAQLVVYNASTDPVLEIVEPDED